MSDKKTSREDLIGFKEFLDQQTNAEKSGSLISAGTNSSLTSSKREVFSNFDSLTFLERESARLSKTLKFCEEKSFLLKRFPQDTQIIITQETQIIEQRDQLIKKLKRYDSPMSQNLNEILQNHFS